jgi:hypothetical protein
MADLMTETNYLNPDVELIAEINTPESFQTFAEVLNTGHGVIGTTHAGDVETLVNRVVEQNVPTYLLDEVDLLVFPRHVDGERYVGEVVEFVDEDRFREFDRERDDDRCGVVRKDDATVYWNTVARRRHDGTYEFAYDHPTLGDDERECRTTVFEGIAEAVDKPVERVEESFHRKHRYVRYLEREGITDGDELFAFLADLRTDEAATVERLQRRTPPEFGTGRPVDLPTDTGDESGGETVVGSDSGPPSAGPQTDSRPVGELPDSTDGTDDVIDESRGTEPETSSRNDPRPDGSGDARDGSDGTDDETATGRVDPSGEEDGD